MKITNIVLGVLFLLFAIVQYNDPDPWLWMLLYGFVAGILLFAAFGKREKWLAIAGFVVCTIWLLTLLPDFINWIQMGMPTITASMKTEEPHIEYTREFLGLGICMLALFFNWRKGR
jgi:hypothetical protein